MKDIINKKLNEIEQAENIIILYAVESGSRAWGFASRDSDYDVRFIYVCRKNHYLRLDKTRDVLEYPLTDMLDINGWNFDKMLKLLHASNPTLFEWSNSPIVYKTTDTFRQLRPLINDYFMAKSGLWHYLSMAEGNYREYLKGDMVKAKKYFYVIRPLLACRWILERHTPPPVLFAELAETQLEPEIKPLISDLLRLKASVSEIGEIPKIVLLNEFIEHNMKLIRDQIEALPQVPALDWERLNHVFLSVLDGEEQIYTNLHLKRGLV